MIKHKLLALDLDGSLLTDNKEISSVNRYWIRKAEEAGVIVSFATGRGRATSEQYWDAVKPQAPMIMVNGAEVWKNHSELMERHFLTEEEIRQLYDLVSKEEVWIWGHRVGGIIRHSDLNSNTFDDHWLKFGLSTDDLSVIEKLRETISQWSQFEVTSSAPNNLEISRKGVSKASGLAKIAHDLGIDRNEVIAVGDSLNDLEMIQWAGLGVAMGNAEAAVKEAADEITATNEEDGVAKAIQRYLFGLE